ncbi:glycosyltransferase [Brachybacterium sp. EF45031]|uniref:glycosyltransferase family 2 protein n=1 Tax=Brachybacterium sillae TaxID=2810536 RepID=UPI00217E9610|nr:glycosyltransferase family 2 protein [Brachybacterium sillae]MCS6711634.1 glycosyltransferase [Brachybacterium sillae]
MDLTSALTGVDVLVLSPHLDDALFSAHTVLRDSVRTARTVQAWTVFAGAPEDPTPTEWDRRCGYDNAQSLIRDRRAEDLAAFANLPEVEVRHLDMLERAYSDPERRERDMTELLRLIDAWRAEIGPKGGVILLPVGAGTRMAPGVADLARATLDRVRSAFPRRGSRAAAPSTHTPVPAPAPASTPDATGSAGTGTSGADARSSAGVDLRHNAIRTAAGVVRSALHWDFQRRRAAAQRRGMLANEDHVAVRDVVREHCTGAADVKVWFYEELPYLWGERGDAQARSLQSPDVPLARCEVPVDRAAKVDAITRYRSQVRLMDPVKRRLESAATLPETERLWVPVNGRLEVRDALAPGITVVIPAYNAAATIGLQLEALSRQQDAPEFEVVIVDNGSTDDLLGAVEPYRSGRLDLRIVRATERQGVSYARNVGIGEARREHLVICDADDVVSQHWLRDMAAALAGWTIISGSARPTPDSAFTDVDAIWSWLDSEETGTAPSPHPADPGYPIMMGGDCGMRTAFARAIGGFDQSFVRGSDDVDFALRAQHAGARIGQFAGARIAYRDRPTVRGTAKKSAQRAFMHTRLAERHDLWSTSPSLRGNWGLELPKALLVTGMMALRLRRADWHGAAGRVGMSAGLLSGYAWHHVLGRGGEPELGIGLDHGSGRVGDVFHASISPVTKEL